jgi:hypothetical protein
MNKELGVSFFLACVVVGGVLWLVADSEQRMRKHPIPDASINAYPSRPVDPQDRVSLPSSKLNMTAQENHAAQSGIIKCIMNGKTIYSDEKCPAGAATQQVKLHDTAGVVSPPKAILSKLTAERLASENALVLTLQKPVALPMQSKKTECEALNKHIEWLDSMARQPQTGQMQDWIRQERKKARDQQFAIHC